MLVRVSVGTFLAFAGKSKTKSREHHKLCVWNQSSLISHSKEIVAGGGDPKHFEPPGTSRGEKIMGELVQKIKTRWFELFSGPTYVGNWQQNIKTLNFGLTGWPTHIGELVCTNLEVRLVSQNVNFSSKVGQFAICGTNSYVTALSALHLALATACSEQTFLCTHHNINHTSKDEFDEIDDIPTAYLLYHSICIQCNKLLIYILWEEHQL